jgi:flavin-binding protein dodecin
LPRTPSAHTLGARSQWSAKKCAFADIRNRYTELTAAPARGSIQTPKKPNAFGVSAQHSKRRKLHTPPLPLELRCGATDGFQRFVDVCLRDLAEFVFSHSDTIAAQGGNMAQKVIDIVGASKESFAKAAENAVAEAAKTVRGLRWARVADFEMQLDGKKITEYRVTTRIYFDIERK